LVAKLRRVEAELVKEWNQRTGMMTDCKQLEEEVYALQKEKADSEKIVASLEHDLDKAISSSVSPSKPKRKVVATASDGKPETLQFFLDPEAPPPSGGQLVERWRHQIWKAVQQKSSR
jgi:homeobox protein cut-like